MTQLPPITYEVVHGGIGYGWHIKGVDRSLGYPVTFNGGGPFTSREQAQAEADRLAQVVQVIA